jgi:hypothetical protein
MGRRNNHLARLIFTLEPDCDVVFVFSHKYIICYGFEGNVINIQIRLFFYFTGGAFFGSFANFKMSSRR